MRVGVRCACVGSVEGVYVRTGLRVLGLCEFMSACVCVCDFTHALDVQTLRSPRIFLSF